MTTALSTAPLPAYHPERSYRIVGSAYRFIVTTPDAAPELWDAYLAGAHAAYARHGTECALDSFCNRDSTSVFFAAVDADENVVGGVRAQGPYTSVDQAHAAVEWSGHAGEHALRKMISDRLPFGVAEVKTAWVEAHIPAARKVSDAIARTAIPLMMLLNAQFLLATAADFALSRWTSSGGRIADAIAPVPYPTEAYPTRAIWWDRRTVLRLADPDLLQKMLSETAELADSIRNADAHRHLAAIG